MTISRAEERRLAFQNRMEKLTTGFKRPAREVHFKVVMGVQHVAYISAVKDGLRYNITDVRISKPEILSHEDVKAIRRMIETGQCDEGNEAVYYTIYDQDISKDPSSPKLMHRSHRFSVMGN